MRAVWMVLRSAVALGGGYAVSAAVAAGLAFALPRATTLARAEAVVLAGMFGVFIYLGLLLWMFRTGSFRLDRGAHPPSFRRAMSALHTWFGVVLGSVLFVVFWMGSLSVFDREIDRWMMPATRLPSASRALSLDAAARALPLAVHDWSITLPSAREPTFQLRFRDESRKSQLRHLDPTTGAMLEVPASLGATGFLFPFHFTLQIGWHRVGIWLAGLAALSLLALVVSGVVTHVHFFREFFTFRTKKSLSRSSLDLHTTLGVLALPFFTLMPLSALILFFSFFFPQTWQAAYEGDRSAFEREVFGDYDRPALGQPGHLGSLDRMREQAEQHWNGGSVSTVRVRHAGDAASFVEMDRSDAHQVSANLDQIYFDGATGRVLAEHHDNAPITAVQHFLSGLHLVHFDDGPLRWLYFLSGLGGCGVILTGFSFWLEARRERHARQGLHGARFIESLSLGSSTGVIAATLAFFVANRALPVAPSIAGCAREQLETGAFYVVWLIAFAHAAWRCRAAWAEQCWAIAALALGAVALNWWSTGDHLARALARRSWCVAGMDLMLLCAALIAATTARQLRTRTLQRERLVTNALRPTPTALTRSAHG